MYIRAQQTSRDMGWFDSFRHDGFNTYYDGRLHSAIFDLKLVIIVYFALVVATALTVLVIGGRGRERWTTLLRFVLSLHTGVIILVSLRGQEWQVGYVETTCSYTVTYNKDITAQMGVLVGLKHFNITMKGYMNTSQKTGSFYYNEQFTYDKVTDMKRQFPNALKRGLPNPILSVLEYITVDDGELLWMRGLHESGHFTYILLWCALVMWVVCNVLIGFVVSRGALLWTVTGSTMIVSQVIYHILQPREPLEIHFKDGILSLHYGWCFWLLLSSGIVTFATGIIVLSFYYMYPEETNSIFLIDTAHLKSDDSDDINRYSGPLEISTPYSQRRKSSSSLSYTNLAFLHGENNMKQKQDIFTRSQSFDFGHLVSNTTEHPLQHKTNIKPLISITEELNNQH